MNKNGLERNLAIYALEIVGAFVFFIWASSLGVPEVVSFVLIFITVFVLNQYIFKIRW